MTVPDENYKMNNCAAIILAAGKSSRLGQPKQLLQYQNKILLQHAIDVAKQSEIKQVIVVLGSGYESIIAAIDLSGIHVVKNDRWQTGIASSINCGINALREISPTSEAAILMVSDQPYITPSLLNSLISEQLENGKPIVACEYDNTIGIPAIFHKSIFDQLTELKGDTGAKKIIKQYSDVVSTVSFLMGGIDIDTLDDYETLIK